MHRCLYGGLLPWPERDIACRLGKAAGCIIQPAFKYCGAAHIGEGLVGQQVQPRRALGWLSHDNRRGMRKGDDVRQP